MSRRSGAARLLHLSSCPGTERRPCPASLSIRCVHARTLAQALRTGKRSIPQNERVFARLLVVVAAHGFDMEVQTLVQRTGGDVRLPDFERRAACAAGDRIAKDFAEQLARQAAAPELGLDREAVDVELVEDHPAGAIGCERAVRPA